MHEHKPMTRTEYLYGVDCSFFPEQEEFAKKRIQAARSLKAELAELDLSGLSTKEVDRIHNRYREVDAAEHWNVRLLEEALGAEV